MELPELKFRFLYCSALRIRNVASWVSVVFRSGECGILGVRGLFSDQAIVAVLGVWSEPAN